MTNFSTTDATQKQKQTTGGSKSNSVLSCCCLSSAGVCLVLGFLAGLICGFLAQRHGFSPGQWDSVFASNSQDEAGLVFTSNGDLVSDGSFKCTVRLNSQEKSDLMQTCDMCSQTRLLNVSNAWYADCNGLYSLTNLTSVWDKKRSVFERISGGINPRDKRYIYWNAHFYGPDFYGWSIGDSRSLSESGPFHAQGRAGVKDQPWLGSWNDNVTVTMVTCNPGGTEANRIRFDKQME